MRTVLFSIWTCSVLSTCQDGSYNREWFFRKSTRRRLEEEKDEFYQMLVKGNNADSNGNSYVKARITTVVAVFENVK